MLGEICPAGRLYSVCPAAEIHIIAICLEDFLFFEHVFKLKSEQDFFEFAGMRLFETEKEIARELLGQRAGPALDSSGPQVLPQRSQDAYLADTLMPVESRILGGKQSVDKIGAD